MRGEREKDGVLLATTTKAYFLHLFLTMIGERRRKNRKTNSQRPYQ